MVVLAFIAARWFRQDSPPETRLLISLDSADARRWVHLSDDPLRADLVGIEWTNDHCTVSVIEVKAGDAAGSECKIDDGKVADLAIHQMLATRRLLPAVLDTDREDELITTPARREVLREHLYRELTKATYSPAERKLWADRLQRLTRWEGQGRSPLSPDRHQVGCRQFHTARPQRGGRRRRRGRDYSRN